MASMVTQLKSLRISFFMGLVEEKLCMNNLHSLEEFQEILGIKLQCPYRGAEMYV
jgi:hypothetical protein